MAMSKQSVTITRPDPGVIQIAIGNETFTESTDRLKEIWNGTRTLEMLVFQFHVALQAAGVNPNTATAAQIKNAIEAQTYWWGN